MSEENTLSQVDNADGEMEDAVTPATTATLTVKGRFLYDRYGNKVVLRGVDLPLLDDWSFPGSDYLDEVAKTGANAVRIQWYDKYPQPAPPATQRKIDYDMVDLGKFLDRCVAAGMIPILMLGDWTCKASMSLLSTYAVPYWTRSSTDPARDVLGTLKARQSCLILNLANELGKYLWAGDPATALPAYVSAYETAIIGMRAAGYTMPLMIDAPDCGTALEAFTTNGSGAALVAADPLKNILLSTHCYWAGYDGRPYVPTAIAADLPIVFGEIANKQGDDPGPFYDLDGEHEYQPTTTGYTYQAFLQSLLADEIGWLAWSWHPDDVPERNMSSDGTFANMTAYGLDIVNNATYGLKATAVRIRP